MYDPDHDRREAFDQWSTNCFSLKNTSPAYMIFPSHRLPPSSQLRHRTTMLVLAGREYYPSSHPRGEDSFSKLLRRLKNGDAEILDHFTRFMIQWVAALNGLLCHIDIVTPIPTARCRLADRGFGIPETFAAAIASKLGGPAIPVLSLTRTTNDFRRMSLRERRREIRGVFAVSEPEQVRGKRILLVDDIVTTGNTLQEATKVLLEVGARWVCPVVLARTQLIEDDSSTGVSNTVSSSGGRRVCMRGNASVVL